ncbi:MAG: FAD-dependent oxidoreductase [Bacteroidales bacterium]|nr:FAD-dependent oxidoreductase [Bacteroidales bacterium]
MKSGFYLLLPVLMILSGCSTKTSSKTYKADVVVYGGTSSAVTTAVQVKRMGKSVIIVSPDKHLGGLSSSGLGFTDTGNKAVIGGLAREFYHLLYQHYMKPESWKWQKQSDYGNRGQGNPALDGENRTMWIFEPHTAEEAFEKMIEKNNIQVYRDEWLDRERGVSKKDGKITSIQTLSGKVFKARIFVDATYEGDLMAAAGVSYHTGREAGSVYGEEWNGVQVGDFPIKHHDFDGLKISPYIIPGDSTSGVLPRVSTKNPGARGEGDSRIQAYCYRLCLTKVEDNRVPFDRPSGYDSTQYELLVRIFNAGWRATFNKFDPIPNAKTDVNNHGPFSSDNIGMNYDYPDASYERRKEIINEHITYQKGLFYFIANDPRVPSDVRNEMKAWGYSKDEFTDNGNWPYNIYVREARRMMGEYVMTENDVLGKRKVPHSIGMGSYNLDSHNTQRYIKPDGFVENEGDIELSTKGPYQIDLGSIMPKREECRNLLVTVCVSSSHIAFGSIRMEPVFMILGQSAGTIASMALEKRKSIYDLSYDEIQAKLLSDGQVLNYKTN